MCRDAEQQQQQQQKAKTPSTDEERVRYGIRALLHLAEAPFVEPRLREATQQQ